MILFLVSNLMPLMVLPLGVVLILMGMRLLGNVRGTISAAFLFLWFFSSGLIAEFLMSQLERPWQRQTINSAKNADAIVVLSGGGIYLRGKSRIVEWQDPDRFIAGLELFKAGKAPKLFFTGQPLTGNKSTGLLYMQEALRRGVPGSAMATTGKVLNTLDEAREISSLLHKCQQKKSCRILLVTSAFHMTRAKAVFIRQGLNVFPFPVDFKVDGKYQNHFQRPFGWLPQASNLSTSSFALRELIGRLIYRAW